MTFKTECQQLSQKIFSQKNIGVPNLPKFQTRYSKHTYFFIWPNKYGEWALCKILAEVVG